MCFSLVIFESCFNHLYFSWHVLEGWPYTSGGDGGIYPGLPLPDEVVMIMKMSFI